MRTSCADLPSVVPAVRASLAHDDVVVVLTGPGRVDLPLLDLLAQLALAARRCGRRLRVQAESDELRRLAAFTGLAGVVPIVDGSGEPGR